MFGDLIYVPLPHRTEVEGHWETTPLGVSLKADCLVVSREDLRDLAASIEAIIRDTTLGNSNEPTKTKS